MMIHFAAHTHTILVANVHVNPLNLFDFIPTAWFVAIFPSLPVTNRYKILPASVIQALYSARISGSDKFLAYSTWYILDDVHEVNTEYSISDQYIRRSVTLFMAIVWCQLNDGNFLLL